MGLRLLLNQILIILLLLIGSVEYEYYLPIVAVESNFTYYKEHPTRTPKRPTPTKTPTPTYTSTPTYTPIPTYTSTPTLPEPTLIPAIGYYVDSVNGSDSNSGTSILYPLKSIGAVNAKTITGSLFLKRNSIWNEKLIIDDQNITITDYGEGNPPILAEIDILSNNNTIKNLEITDAGYGLWIYGDYNLVENLYIHDLHMARNTPGGDDDYGAVAIILSGNYNVIKNNSMINCKAQSYDYGTDGGVIEFWAEANYNVITDNYTYNNDGFLEVGGGEAVGNVIDSNQSIENGKFAVFHLEGTFASYVENFVISNNIINQSYWINLFYFNGNPNLNTVIFKYNNIGNSSGMNREEFLHIYNTYKYHPTNYSTNSLVILGEGEIIQ